MLQLRTRSLLQCRRQANLGPISGEGQAEFSADPIGSGPKQCGPGSGGTMGDVNTPT